jgi:hypothetical protein
MPLTNSPAPPTKVAIYDDEQVEPVLHQIVATIRREQQSHQIIKGEQYPGDPGRNIAGLIAAGASDGSIIGTA